jgi:hypothetical protein
MADATTTSKKLETLTVSEALVIGAGVVGLLRKHGIITPDDQAFDVTRPPAEWTMFAKDVTELLEAQGVAVPENVHKAVNGAAFYLPILLALVAQAH